MQLATPPTPNAPFKAMLVELAEAGMEISREMMVGVRKARSQDERIAYAAAHDRAGRSVRLSIQLHERLERHEREAARAEALGAPPSLAALERKLDPQLDLRKAQVRAAVRRTIEQDYEGEDADVLATALELSLAEHALTGRFMESPAAETVVRIRKTLELPDLKDAPPERPGQAGPS